MKNILKLNAVLLFAVAIFVASCGSSYKEEALAGKVDGKDWTLKAAKVTINPFDTTVYIIDFYENELTDPCGLAPAGNSLTTTCPQQVGEHEFGILKFRFCNFITPNSSLVSNDGAVEILTIDKAKGELTGRMKAKYDGNNEVNGTFTAKICNQNAFDNALQNVLDTLKTDSVK